MDRRKYLSTLAAGAALGTVAVGLAACGGGGTGETTKADSTAELQHSHAPGPDDQVVNGKNLWGYLRIFPKNITKVADAKPGTLNSLTTRRIPYYNNTGIDMSANPIVGFTLLKIGCPVKFVIAINLTTVDGDHPEVDPPYQEIVDRNDRMDNALEALGYFELPWEEPDNKPCP